MGRLVGAQAVGVQGSGQDIHGGGRGGKTGGCQFRCLACKFHSVGRVLPCADGLVGSLGNIRGRNAHGVGHVRDLTAQLLDRKLAKIGDGPDFGKRCLVDGAVPDRALGKIRQLAAGRLYQVCDQRSGGDGHAADTLREAAGVQLGVAGNAKIKCHCVHLSIGARAQGHSLL